MTDNRTIENEAVENRIIENRIIRNRIIKSRMTVVIRFPMRPDIFKGAAGKPKTAKGPSARDRKNTTFRLQHDANENTSLSLKKHYTSCVAPHAQYR